MSRHKLIFQTVVHTKIIQLQKEKGLHTINKKLLEREHADIYFLALVFFLFLNLYAFDQRKDDNQWNNLEFSFSNGY